MTPAPLPAPRIDPTPIFDLFRGNHASELLTAAVAHLKFFQQFDSGPQSFEQLQRNLNLADRPANVVLTGMRAMGLIQTAGTDHFDLSAVAREHLLPGREFDISGYIGLAAQSPGVLELVNRLRTNRPAGSDTTGAAFIFRDGIESAMETEATARSLTLSLAGRAKNVAPVLADRAPLQNASKILDVGGGSGIYAFAMLRRFPYLRAVIFDRAEVLKVAREMALHYGVLDRAEFIPGDMFKDPLPTGCDQILLSNILHDWDVPQCQALIHRCSTALPPGGQLLIHDVFLNDDLGGPLPVALYSVSLFSLTEGRAYSANEYRQWLTAAGLTPSPVVPTLVSCAVLPATRP
jgi:ubiquinone/menaquinone biosynthesis C-methylase UbiE